MTDHQLLQAVTAAADRRRSYIRQTLEAVTAAADRRRRRLAADQQRLKDAMAAAAAGGVPSDEMAEASRQRPGRSTAASTPARPDRPAGDATDPRTLLLDAVEAAAARRRGHIDRLLEALRAAAAASHRHRGAENRSLTDAMRAADTAGATRREIARAAGLTPMGASSRLGSRHPTQRPRRPDRPRADTARLLAAVESAADAHRSNPDTSCLDDAIRAAVGGGVARSEIADTAGVCPSTVSRRVGTRQPPRPRTTVYDRDLDDAIRAAEAAGITRQRVAAAAGEDPGAIARRLGPRSTRPKPPS